MPVVGSRFIVEAGFIIAVAVIAGIEHLSTWWIIAVVAVAWLIVAAVEIAVWARKVVAQQPQAVDEPADLEPAPTPEYASRPPVVVRPQPSVETREAEPSSEPEPEPEQTREPERPRIVAVPALPPEPASLSSKPNRKSLIGSSPFSRRTTAHASGISGSSSGLRATTAAMTSRETKSVRTS